MTGRHAIFAYGTLQVAEVLQAVTGRLFPGHAAVLCGYDRFLLEDCSYPGIIESPGALTHGLLYVDVDPHSLRRLDHFEDDLYERRTVTVEAAGTRRTAEAWVVPHERSHLLTQRRWDLDEFKRKHLTTFLDRRRI